MGVAQSSFVLGELMDTYNRHVGDPLVRSLSPIRTRTDQGSFGFRERVRGLIDKLLAVFAVVFFSPFLVLVALAILITDGRPVLFGHQRIGKGGRKFKCLKFRTMRVDAAERLAELLAEDPEARAEWEANQKLEHDPRVTCLGHFLRKSSLDELPQFWNVIRGDMALVGPRPIIESEVHHYGDHYSDYLSVKPGITGLWQVSGRSDTTYDERVAMDLDYIGNRPFRRDLLILFKTVGVVLKGSGAT